MTDAHRGKPELRTALEQIKALMSQVPPIVPEAVQDWGRFDGDLQVRMLDDGRLCQLLADYGYYRPNGSYWSAPRGTKVDGASIPKVFWSLIGGPLEGKYRNASVIHDRYCDTHERPWPDVHRTFYEAMRCKGVPPTQAKIMYYAVYRFGPRWPAPGEPVPETAAPLSPQAPADADAASLLADAQTIADEDPSLDSIDRMADGRSGRERLP